MTVERRSGITRQLLRVLEERRDQLVTIEELAELVDYSKGNVSTLINQVRKNRPNLVIESPIAGAFIYRGVRTVDEVLAEETRPTGTVPTPPARPRSADKLIAPKPAKVLSDGSLMSSGDLVEVIGFLQDGTPIARAGTGK